MRFWAAFFKTRPKKTQPEHPRFCSESNEINILAKIHLLYLYLTCSHVENKKQKKQKQNKI